MMKIAHAFTLDHAQMKMHTMNGVKMASRKHWGSIRKLPSGNYQARWREDKEPVYQTFATRFLAETFLQTKARELGREWSQYKIARGKRIRSYGITVDEFNEMMLDQDGKCFICKGDNGNIALCIDHDHKTGKVRGLLCNKCNRAIGLLDDNPERLNAAINYLINGVPAKEYAKPRFYIVKQ